MRLSIVTPSYNQGQYIERTIQSVLSQGHPDLEYWVIDGGSADDTTAILRRYEDRLRWVSEKDRGQGDAVNKGFHRATGDVIGWLNSDDTYAPGAFEAVMRAFEENPAVNFVFGDCNMIDEEDRLLKTRRTGPFNYNHLVWMGVCYLFQPSIFFRRSLLETVGGCDITLKHGMDYDLWCRMGPHIQPHYLRRPLSNWRYQDSSKTCSERHVSLEEGKKIRRRYMKSKWGLPWCWYYDLRVKLYVKAEPFMLRRKETAPARAGV